MRLFRPQTRIASGTGPTSIEISGDWLLKRLAIQELRCELPEMSNVTGSNSTSCSVARIVIDPHTQIDEIRFIDSVLSLKVNRSILPEMILFWYWYAASGGAGYLMGSDASTRSGNMPGAVLMS